ncbi:MAG: hypothetical protein R3C19_25000 [Planctomycetaceae bacterium]
MTSSCIAVEPRPDIVRPSAVIDAEQVATHFHGRSPVHNSGFAVAAFLLGSALLSSGAAGLINQVIWQRALKVFLGGSETVCSTVVVLVFMAGLGAGSWWSGRRSAGLRNPLATFGRIELLLGIVNLGICGILAADLSHTVFAAQKAALSLGVPLLLMYALGAVVALCVPCFLMGATMPLAAEVCQRNLRLQDSRLLGWLLFINTLGSVGGAVVSSGYMLPELGLSRSLIAAAALNIFAAGLLFAAVRVVARKPLAAEPADLSNAESQHSRNCATWRPSESDLLALGLGFCSLAYEMHLFRLMPLKQQPLPFTFAAVLSGFLFFWSLGAALSSRRCGISISRGLQLCAAGCLLSIVFAGWDSWSPINGVLSLITFVAARSHFFLPCLLFGYLFSRVTEEAAKSWGRDVGRIYVWNTIGSCLGILLMTFVGYEIPFYLAIIAIALILLSLHACVRDHDGRLPSARSGLASLGAAMAIVVACLVTDTSRLLPGHRLFCGRDGVIVVLENGDMIWDGLWHSSISDGTSHLGTHNWNLAVLPAACHTESPVRDVCVIGIGTGITAATLAKLDSVERVDAYDISRVLEDVFAAYPDGTLNITSNPKINLIWQDARSGLELNPTKYDLIQTQPLYLKQAGSGLLNSEEFLRLVSRRLKPGGVFCLYCNGTPEQAFLVRETADQVFAYRETFFNGYLAMLSNDPISLSEESLRHCLNSGDPMWTEVRGHAETSTAEKIAALRDVPRLPGFDRQLTVTDDCPIVEYPVTLQKRIAALNLPFQLPAPDSSHSSRTDATGGKQH